MPGMRKAIPKEDTDNFHGGAARRVEINALLGGARHFPGVEKRMFLKMRFVSMGCLCIILNVNP